MDRNELNLIRFAALNDLGLRITVGDNPRLPVELTIDDGSQLSHSFKARNILGDAHASINAALDAVDRVLALEGEISLVDLHAASLRRLSLKKDFIE